MRERHGTRLDDPLVVSSNHQPITEPSRCETYGSASNYWSVVVVVALYPAGFTTAFLRMRRNAACIDEPIRRPGRFSFRSGGSGP